MESQRGYLLPQEKGMTAWKVLRETEGEGHVLMELALIMSGMNQLEDVNSPGYPAARGTGNLWGFSFLLLPPVLTTCCPTKGETRW